MHHDRFNPHLICQVRYARYRIIKQPFTETMTLSTLMGSAWETENILR
jgi:hypothetical protein